MDSRLIATIIIFPIWLILVLFFRRHRQWLLYYMFGAFGLALLLVFVAELTGFDQLLVNVASFHVSFIAKQYFHLSVDLLTNGRFQVMIPGGGMSILKLGIECSAVLESAILLGLVAFYPIFDIDQKILRVFFGLFVTYALNIARLLIIVLIAYKFGPDSIFVAHAFVARAFFFLFELMLYWWLMTKPSVKTVGDSLSNNIPIAQAAKIGVSLKRRNALMQIIFILFMIGGSIYTFIVSPDYPKIFANMENKKRPIIYQEETAVESSERNNSLVKPVAAAEPVGLDQLLPLSLDGGGKKVIGWTATKDMKLNIKVVEGKREIALRVLDNDHQVGFVTAPSWVYLKESSLVDPITVKTGDSVAIKVQNLSESPDNYLLRFYSEDSIATSKVSTDVSYCTLQESMGKQPLPAVAGTTASVNSSSDTSVNSLDKEIKASLRSGEESNFRFNFDNSKETIVEISGGNKSFTGQVLLNGQMVDFVTGNTGAGSVFHLPLSVKSDDVLDLKIKNTANVSADFLIKIYPAEDNEQ